MLFSLLARAKLLSHSFDGRRYARCDSADGDTTSRGHEDLRRFETLPPEGSKLFLVAEVQAAPDTTCGDVKVSAISSSSENEAARQTARLKSEIEHLKTLLEERAVMDAEAWRMQKAVQHQEEEDAEKLMDLLRAHDESFAITLEETKTEVEARVVLRMREEQELVQTQYDAQVEALTQAYRAQLQEATAAAEAAAERQFRAALENERAKLTTAHETSFLYERQANASGLTKLQTDVDALAAAWTHDTSYKRTSHAVHQLSAAVMSLEESLAGRSVLPLASQCHALPGLAKRLDDPLLSEIGSVLQPLADAKIATLPQLQARFEQAATAGQVAALVPEGSGMWGHALASLISTLTIVAPRHVLPSETASSEASRVFSHAAAHLDEGSLAGAVREVRQLRGPPAAVFAGWLAAAEQRLLIEQVLAAAKAEASITMAALC
mmetsp:Transcript_11246/g.18845  ORF Transcript_11246/g.18845 Transcript_11246/m.18845 type:complete len:438 (+) Transcript_11246:101-1414(+)